MPGGESRGRWQERSLAGRLSEKDKSGPGETFEVYKSGAGGGDRRRKGEARMTEQRKEKDRRGLAGAARPAASWVIVAVLAAAVCLCVKYSDHGIQMIRSFLGTVKPLVYGFAIAYVLNIFMKKLEKLYFPGKTSFWVERSRRPVCVFSSILLVLVFIVLLTFLVVPSLTSSIRVLTKDIPRVVGDFQVWLVELLDGNPDIQDYVEGLEIDWKSIYDKVGGFLSSGITSIFNSAFSVANLVVSFIFTGVVALIFSIYMLCQKERIGGQLEKIARAYVPERIRDSVGGFLRLANETFTSFITGQLLEAVILGTLCGAGMFLLRMPYALMTGVIVGVSALIPVMGAYIGAFVGAFMIVTVSPLKAVEFLVYLVILQQLEGNLIYPRVVGGSIGLPGIWVLASVTVGGGLFGVPGMLLGVPLTATVYKWLRNNVNKKLSAV